MYLYRLVGPASLFCLSKALFLPPNPPIADTDLIKILNHQSFAPIDEWLVQIDYPEIPVDPNSKTDRQINHAESILEFNFTVHHQETDRLMLNELQIYPTHHNSLAPVKPLTAPHLVKNGDSKWEYVSAAELGYSVDAFSSPRKMKGKNVEEISIRIDVFGGTGGIFLNRLQTIELQLLSIPSGKLMIQIADTGISKPQLSKNLQHSEKCISLLCKARTSLSNILTKAKGAMKQCHMKAFSQHQHGNLSNLPLSDKVQSQFLKYRPTEYFHDTILPYLVPTLAGIFAGISAGLIGMLFGHAAMYLWSILCGRNSNKYKSINHLDIDETEQNIFKSGQAPIQLLDSRRSSIDLNNEKIDQ